MLQVSLIEKHTGEEISACALVDCGIEGMIINHDFAKKNNLTLRQLKKPLLVRNVDGSNNKSRAVLSTTIQTICLWMPLNQYHEERSKFYVTAIGTHDIILETDWLLAHNPEVNWTTLQLAFTQCPKTCTLSKCPLIVHPLASKHPVALISSLDPHPPDIPKTSLSIFAVFTFIMQHQLFKYHKPTRIQAKTTHSTNRV
jgi:hypothetical protein